MNYHDPYLKMFSAVADTIETLDAEISVLTELREALIEKQREAEELVIKAGDLS